MLTTANSSGRVGFAHGVPCVVSQKHLENGGQPPQNAVGGFFLSENRHNFPYSGWVRIQQGQPEEARRSPFSAFLNTRYQRGIKTSLVVFFITLENGVFMSNIISLSDLNTTVNHEPRVSHTLLAEKLGYGNAGDLIQLIERNRPEFEAWGVLPQIEEKPKNAKGGRPKIILFLNEGQAVLATCLSRTPQAIPLRKGIIEVFMAWRSGQLISTTTISPTQQHAIQQAVKAKHEASGNYYAGIWSRFNNHFKIARYSQLPATRFDEALSYIATMPEAEQKALPAPVAKIGGMEEHYLRAIYINTLNMMEELKIAAEDLEQIPYVPKRFSVEQHLGFFGDKLQAVMLSITPLAKKLLPDGEPKTRPMVQYLFA